MTPAENGTLIGPTIRRHRLGAELRKLREAGGYRLEDVAAKLDVAASTLSRIETGKAPARTSYVHAMLDFYEVNDSRQRQYLADLAREGQRKGWWAQYDDMLPAGAGVFLGLESAAASICTFAVQTVPALLQASGYAEAVIRAARPGFTGEQVQDLAAVTMRRQELSRDHCKLHAVIDESALLRTVGSADVMARQLDHLAGAMTSPDVTIQVLRMTAPAQVLCPGFTIMGFAHQADADVASRNENEEHVTVVSNGEELARLRRTFAELSRHAESAASSARVIGELRKR